MYFLIEPNDAARREFPKLADGEEADLLLNPLLTSRDVADRSSWRVDEAELAVKLIFLSRIREYTPLEGDAAACRILGSSGVFVELFDRWWNIRRLDLEEGPSEQMEGYLKRVIDKVQSTGNGTVDKWVSGLKHDAA